MSLYLEFPISVLTDKGRKSINRERLGRGNHRIVGGITRCYTVGKVEAIMQKDSFAKGVVDKDSGRIFALHIYPQCQRMKSA
jgi:hypothetical protein